MVVISYILSPYFHFYIKASCEPVNSLVIPYQKTSITLFILSFMIETSHIVNSI